MKNAEFEELCANHEAIPHFHSLPGTNRIIKSDLLSTKKPRPENREDPNQEPALELKKNGEFVEMISVKCPCGRSTQIVLDYEASNEVEKQTPLDVEQH